MLYALSKTTKMVNQIKAKEIKAKQQQLILIIVDKVKTLTKAEALLY